MEETKFEVELSGHISLFLYFSLVDKQAETFNVAVLDFTISN